MPLETCVVSRRALLQDKEAKKLDMVHKEKLKIEAEFDKKTRSIKTQNKIKLSKDMSGATLPFL